MSPRIPRRMPASCLLAQAIVASVLLGSSPAQVNEDRKLMAAEALFQDRLGWSVAVTEEYALVAEPYDWEGSPLGRKRDGAVFVFRRTPLGWERVQELRASDGNGSGIFGWSIAFDGDTAIIADDRDDHGGPQAGSVYVFERYGDHWVETQKILPGVGESYGRFGRAVSLDGDRLLIAQTGLDRAHVYRKETDGWVHEAILVPSPPSGFDSKGPHAVALHGDVAVLGERLDEQATVFEKIPAGWVQTAVLTDPTPLDSDDHFGGSVAVSEDLIVVGKPVHDCPFAARPGSVLIFERAAPPPGNWSFVQEIKASNASTTGCGSDNFGSSVALENRRILIGAKAGNKGKQKVTGLAYLFEEGPQGWIEIVRLVASDARRFDDFGTSVALSKSFALVGAPFTDGFDGHRSQSGAAYLFELPLGESYCPAVANSTGQGGEMVVKGSVSVGVGALRLIARRLPPDTGGQFLASPTPGLVVGPGGSQGNLCLGGPIHRVGPPSSSGPKGNMFLKVDPGAVPLSIAAGETWYFQAWYRDRNPQPTWNFTDGVEIQFR